MQDNFAATVESIVSFIAANAPAGLQRRKDHLEKTSGYWSMDFRRASSRQTADEFFGDLSAHVCIQITSDSLPYEESHLEDEAGNTFRKLEVKAQVSWPSWGGTDPSLAAERLGLMQEACRFAADLEARFKEPVYRLYKTAEEKRAEEEGRLRREAEVKIRAAVEKSVKGMRVGNERCVADASVPAGLYEGFTMNQKTYRVQVTSTGMVSFLRTA